ncbi:MobA/MobL family protein [Lachnobacterium bovis]|jgi:hypothetical protein|uniref:MobA/MobL family protein n=2 Tax=Lachnobacterium bovis TaxID=140626 RepID=UPI00040BC244|nr:MobA/MobL family protein [Lachnobacterium bovis]SDW98017.1 MobA/MobL family protein [Lachnospiraceae bacterium KHCPX20]SFG32829.1 MobA/MobL family protein [Lachnospiraceae bacterium C7]
MPRNSFVQMSKLHNVRGRIYYISSNKKQENLYAVYETTDRKFWTELAKCNQAEFKKSGTEGKCIEAREIIIALPESFVDYSPDGLLKYMTDKFKNRYGVDCIAALHHNKRKTNYHIHLIFAERNYLDEPIEKIATRNMFYDEKGNHVRTKKEILDENGHIRKRCKVIKKGEVYERQIFTIKDKRFKQENFLDEVKEYYTDLMNGLVKDEKEKLAVFKRGDVYLATKKIGKNNPKEQAIKNSNDMVKAWNKTVDQALVTGITREEIITVKKEQVVDKVQQSIKERGHDRTFLFMILFNAVEFLEKLIREFILKLELRKEKKDVVVFSDHIQEQPVKKETFVPKRVAEPKEEKPAIPPRPKAPASLLKWNQMLEANDRLKKQNQAIFKVESDRNDVYMELAKCTGIFKAGKRKKLQEEYDNLTEKVDNMKSRLKKIVQEYGYKTVDEFYRLYNNASSDYYDYKEEVKKWESQYGENSLHRKLTEKQAEVKKRQEERGYIYNPPMNGRAR